MRTGQKSLTLFLILTVLTSPVIQLLRVGVTEGSAVSHDADAMWIDPADVTFSPENATVGSRFSVTVSLNMTENVVCWQISLLYNRTQLKCVDAGFTDDFMDNPPHGLGGAEAIDAPLLGNGSLLIFECCSRSDVIHGPRCGSLIWAEFQILVVSYEVGKDITSKFDISTWYSRGRTWVWDTDLNPIEFTTYDGSYKFVGNYPPPPDVAVTGVQASQSAVYAGYPVSVDVNLWNKYDTVEDVNVTLYADNDTSVIGDEINVGTNTVVLPAFGTSTTTFSWDTTGAAAGNYLLTACASPVPGEVYLADNNMTDGSVQIYPPMHDVAVVGVQASQSAVYAGDPLFVDVNLWNKGDLVEDVNVTLYADNDTSVIGDEINVGTNTVVLPAFGMSTTTFSWDTTGATAENCTLTACASPLPGEVYLADNNMTDGIVQIFSALLPCPDIDVVCPANLTVNPSIFAFDSNLHARLINIGNVSIVSTGFEGGLRIVGSRNGTVYLCVNQPAVDNYLFYLPQYGEVQVPLWLMFQPEAHWGSYVGTYTLNLTVCGMHRQQLTINEIDITVCQNGCYIVNNDTVTFTWNLTGGSLVYLEAETDLPPGWTYNVNPPIGTYFETPHIVTVNITAPPDAKEGDIGRVTLRAYKNSTGTMIWQFIYFASTDNKPPKVERVETPTLSPDGYLLFNTTASDHSGISRVFLNYSVDGGPWQNATMQWASGDTFNQTQYTCRQFFGTGPKTIQYCVSVVDWLGNETDTATQTISLMNDVAVAAVSLDRIVVFEGYNVSLSASVVNHGTLPLSFINVALYANSTLVAEQAIFNLQNGTTTALNFSVLLPKGQYVISALAVPLPDESNVNNNMGHGTVVVSRVGDLTGAPGHSIWDFVPDGSVDGSDLIVAAMCFGSYPGVPPPYRWNANCDITNDNSVDGSDLIIIARHFGEHSP